MSDLVISNWDVANKALEAWLPQCQDMRVVVHANGDRMLNYYSVRGNLPSGREYEVPIEIDITALYYDEPVGAWLNSTELARELKKAVRAFKVAVALDGEQSISDIRPKIQGAIVRNGDKLHFSAIMPSGTDRLHVEAACPKDGSEWHAANNTGFGNWEVALHPKYVVITSLRAYGDNKSMIVRTHYRI